MLTMMKTFTSQAVSEWVKVFPLQATKNYTSSVTFMKQLTVIALSTVTYLKDMFPEDSYVTEYFNGIRLKILKSECRDEFANFFSKSLTQSFEAFNKKYLHRFALCFYKDECKMENLIEYYIFEYTYKSDRVTMNIQTKSQDRAKNAEFSFENVREQTIELINDCVAFMQDTQSYSPANLDVSIRLYYNEGYFSSQYPDTPWDYQAPGYLAVGDGEDHLAASLKDTVALGLVATPFHQLATRAFHKSLIEDPASNQAIASQRTPLTSEAEIDLILQGLSGVFSGSSEEVKGPQESCPKVLYDPISELLSPVEKESLQNASNIGRIVDADEVLNTARDRGDPTLEQYREILSNDRIDEPASIIEELEKNVPKKSVKRKMCDIKPQNKFGLRIKTKRSRSSETSK